MPGDRLESHMVYSMSDRAIRHVYVHGKPAVKDGRLCGIEEAELRRRVVASSRRFFPKSGSAQSLIKRVPGVRGTAESSTMSLTSGTALRALSARACSDVSSMK